MVKVVATPALKTPSQQPEYTNRFLRTLQKILSTRLAGVGLVLVVMLFLLAVFADFFSPYSPAEQNYSAVLQAPSLAHPMGTDGFGRDVLSRVIYGSQVSLRVGVVAVGFAAVAGVVIGLLAGYLSGWTDYTLMRLMDALYSFPALLLALALTAALGPGVENATFAVGIVYIPVFARLVRAQTLSVREREFVLAARVAGAGAGRIMLRHIWPNVAAPILVQASLSVSFAIITEASLSFLGLGVQPPTPSWGSMLKDGYPFMEKSPWLAVFPGAAIFVTVLAINFLGDGIRAALDPKLRQRGVA